jgi:hypothetical protein
MKQFNGSAIYDALIESGFEVDDVQEILRNLYSFYINKQLKHQDESKG